ncbi:hypothetical protein ACFFKU_05225 [Kineococcus gynurae]|uniref:Uncharacterized protein n=1 Tax=Kineococcus gynurae TaxID=452979 RepID=A0ABV5LN71_9ACTN
MTHDDLLAALLLLLVLALGPLAARWGADTRTSRAWTDGTDVTRPGAPDRPARKPLRLPALRSRLAAAAARSRGRESWWGETP